MFPGEDAFMGSISSLGVCRRYNRASFSRVCNRDSDMYLCFGHVICIDSHYFLLLHLSFYKTHAINLLKESSFLHICISRGLWVFILYVFRIAHWSCAHTSHRSLQITIQAGESYRWSPGAVSIYTQSPTHDHSTTAGSSL